MIAADFILELDRRLQQTFRKPVGATIAVGVETQEGPKTLSFTRNEWAKCRDRFARWSLIRDRLERV